MEDIPQLHDGDNAAEVVEKFQSPALLYILIDLLGNPNASFSTKFLYVALLGISTAICPLFEAHSWQTGARVELRFKAAVINEILLKSLRRHRSTSMADAEDTTAGKIVTLMTTDVERIWDSTMYLADAILHPVQIGAAICALYFVVGWPAFVGLGVMLASLPVIYKLTQWQEKVYARLMSAKDKRTDVIHEILQGIRAIKLMEARSNELSELVGLYIQNAVNSAVLMTAPILVAFVTLFTVTQIARQPLGAKKAFTCLTLFNTMRGPLMQLPNAIMSLLQVRVSLERIQKFLEEKDVEPRGISDDGADEDVGFKEAYFTWDDYPHIATTKNGTLDETTPILAYPSSSTTEFEKFSLQNVTVSFPVGRLSVICGATGSGKSSLLQALLGEMARVSGAASLPLRNQKVAYVPQISWLRNATIRENILFGEDFSAERYATVVRACALERDLENLEFGDLTEVGEKGINLSGGQKQRISLARAIYSPATHILLDDPLSAVDSHTAKYLLQHAIMHLLVHQNRTVLLVTHAINLVLPVADNVVVMKNGMVAAWGVLANIMKEADKDVLAVVGRGLGATICDEVNGLEERIVTSVDHSNGHESKDAKRLVEDESVQIGSVRPEIYLSYFESAGGWGFAVALLVSMALERVGAVAADFWVREWTKHSDTNVGSLNVTGVDAPARNLYVLRLVTKGGFGEEGSPLYYSTVYAALFIFGVIATVTPLFIFIVIPVAYIHFAISKRYLATSRSLKRLESVTRSPIISIFSETLNGASTIRAYNASSRFARENVIRVDTNHRAFFYLWTANRWLQTRATTISAIVVFLAGACILVIGVDPGLAGVSLVWALECGNTLIWLVRKWGRLKMDMNAAERINEYMEIDQERPAIVPNMRPPPSWPSKGSIKVNNLEMKYSKESSPILNNVSFEVKGGEKLGVVGRTGAGKSSLSLCLFRIIEPSSGSIIIDGIDITDIGLQDLRSRLTIIPQDPVLFCGTLRTNLDPSGQKEDREVWDCLHKVKFMDTLHKPASSTSSSKHDSVTCGVEELHEFGGHDSQRLSLDFPVAEGGSNFSQGQRQLLCLARAMLKGSKIMVLDEATASVDNKTDAEIQHAIRSPEFASTTVISIAHRLRTVADYDKILVLEHGRVVQFGSPLDLILVNGPLREMSIESGDFDELLDMAKRHQPTI
ncbi:hypothetical protein HDU67_008352 [Dinochytrium kinnereticum]|nr:hypothetical protein HDU67_008352 [Dinochytrium kinnereticum]